MLAHRCAAVLQLGLTRVCGSAALLDLAAATCSPSTSSTSQGTTPSHLSPSAHHQYQHHQHHQQCMGACMSTLAAYRPPRHNPKTLKPMLVKTESSVTAEIQQSSSPDALVQALRGLKFLAPSIAAALLARLAAVQGKELPGSWTHGAAAGELWARGVREADIQLHLMQPQQLCDLLWALSQLQPPSSSSSSMAAGLPPRILSILLHDGGALLAQADPQGIARLASGLKDLKHSNPADWQALAAVACKRGSSLDQASRAEIAQALSASLESGADEQLVGALKQLQAGRRA